MSRTRRAEQLPRQFFGKHTNWADRLMARFGAVPVLYDTYEEDSGSSHYHIQYNQAFDRGTPVTTNRNSVRGGSQYLSTSNDQNEQVMLRMTRGGIVLPDDVRYVVMCYEFAPHSWWKYGLYRFWFTFDIQKGDNRKWFKIAHEWSNNGINLIDNRWMVDTVGNDTQDFDYFEDVGVLNSEATALCDDKQILPWNEPPKYMFNTATVVLDMDTMNYHRFICNNREFSFKNKNNEQVFSMTGGTSLGDDYYNGMNLMTILQNRGSGSTLMSGLNVDMTAVGFVYKNSKQDDQG